eukprot:351689-Chlamydomonas_euryale.AAC.3
MWCALSDSQKGSGRIASCIAPDAWSTLRTWGMRMACLRVCGGLPCVWWSSVCVVACRVCGGLPCVWRPAVCGGLAVVGAAEKMLCDTQPRQPTTVG